MKTLEKQGVYSMNITIAVPDEIGNELNKLPNRDSLILNDLEEVLERYYDEKEEQEFDKAVIEALESDKIQELIKKAAESPPKPHNVIKI
ncbi:hypothetical protein H8D83_01280 [Candidatus Woesearchaeota archaeon]|nr:hypothetical protein [Candidatus Woesearchaeota archaeon]